MRIAGRRVVLTCLGVVPLAAAFIGVGVPPSAADPAAFQDLPADVAGSLTPSKANDVLGELAAPADAPGLRADDLAVAATSDRVAATLSAAGFSDEDYREVLSEDGKTLEIVSGKPLSGGTVAALKGAAGAVDVKVTQGRFAVADLTAEAARLTGLPGVRWAAPAADLSGVDVAVADLAGVKVTSAYPLDVVEAAEPVETAARNADSSPAWGAALLWNRDKSRICSAGIAVHYGSHEAFTTAAHCESGKWYGGKWSNANLLGSTIDSKVDRSHDIRLVSSPSPSHYAWIGAYDSNVKRTVYRADAGPYKGQRVCADGGVTGEVCGKTKVLHTDAYVRLGGRSVGPGFWFMSYNVVNGAQQCVGQPGDSGSPVYIYTRRSSLEIKGFLVAIDPTLSTVGCTQNPAVPWQWPPNAPSSYGFAVNAAAALKSLGVEARVG